MTFFPATSNFLLRLAQDMGGIGELRRRSGLETYIHNFMTVHDLKAELPAIEEFITDLDDDDVYDALKGPSLVFANMAPPFTISFIDSFAQRCNDY